MPLTRVDFICPKCNMFCKPEHAKVEVERTDTRVAYGHERCYRVNDEPPPIEAGGFLIYEAPYAELGSYNDTD